MGACPADAYGVNLGVTDMDEDEAREIAAELTRLAQEMGLIP